MIACKLHMKIHKKGCLDLKNLPLDEGDEVEVIIVKKQKMKNLEALIANDHVWSAEDIRAVEGGRGIINKWGKNVVLIESC